MRNIFKLAMTGKELKRWEHSRKRGEFVYVLIWGVLLFGGVMFVFDTCWTVFVEHKYLFSWADNYRVAADLVGGILFGLLTWHTNESRYSKALMRESSEKQNSPE